jgi:hypothetical protein
MAKNSYAKHSYMVITSNFELEPVINQFFETYPKNEYESFQVVYKTLGEYNDNEFTYMIVFQLPPQPRGRVPHFSDFLRAYCTLNAKTAVAANVSNVFPGLDSKHGRGGHIFGELRNDPAPETKP